MNSAEFLIKIDEECLTGCVSDFVLNEVFHKLMIAEVVKKFKKTAKEAVAYIKRNSGVISNLEIIWMEMDIIECSNVIILEGRSSLFPDFVEISRIQPDGYRCHARICNEKTRNNKHRNQRQGFRANRVAQCLEAVRIVLGLLLVIFLSGYSLIAALFPGKDEPDGT